MAWVLIDDNFPNHPKVIQAGPVAAWLFVCGVAYCRRYHTGGFIPAAAVKTLGVSSNPRRMIDALLEANLLERCDGGFKVHDYEVMYPDDAGDKAEKEERRRQKVEAGRKGGRASWSKRSAEAESKQSAQADLKRPAEPHGAEPHGSGVVLVSALEKREEPRLDIAFLEFQSKYPQSRRKGGFLIQQAFVMQAQKAGSAGALFDALENHVASEQWQTPKLIPGMDTWLTEERWRQRLPSKDAPKPKPVDGYVAWEDHPSNPHRATGTEGAR